MNYNPYAKGIKVSPLVLAGLLGVMCLFMVCGVVAFVAVLAIS